MNLEQIEAFLAIMENKSLTKAAESLFITQPTLTHRLNLLEKSLGVRLVDRAKGQRFAQLTPEGIQFTSIAIKMSKLWSEAQELAHIRNSNTLRISYIPSLRDNFIPELYDRFITKNPSISMQIVSHHAQTAFRLVENFEIDVAFVAKSYPSTGLAITPLYSERYVLLCSANSPYANNPHPNNLDVENEIAMDWHQSLSAWHNHWFGMTAPPKLSTENQELINKQLANGQSWAIVPELYAQQYVEKFGLIACRIQDEPPRRVVKMVTREADIGSPLLQQFTEVLHTIINQMKYVEKLF